ncbi:hypothetical protein N7493_005855 [Penicillium malachiteum]|uniref:Uncharacterized protein n=1 Tax=Penicillium malachiteum TaxID=1324776 RepID=A0AAD6HL62_9EURO|nr:hypothetical protein N7493_005855 [Penicillium malachiteum]
MTFDQAYCAFPARDSFGHLVQGYYAHRDDQNVLRKIKRIHANEIDLEEWIEIPFPVPLWNTLSRMVSVNLETGMVMIRIWEWDE